jgi:hypothetical protein
MSAKSTSNDASRQVHNGATFAVDDVVPARKSAWSETLAQSLARRFCREVLLLPESDKPVINSAMHSLSPSLRAHFSGGIGNRSHPLIDAVQTAFSQHYPLTFSPDSIWLAIAQGFSHHIAANAEALRPRLVRHQGHRELTEQVEDLTLASFMSAIAGFSSQIRDASDPVLHETLLCDFTTTTPAIRTASEVVLMDSYSSYFEYVMQCICGIPRITVTGSPDDWQRIRARVEVLETYDLGWWVARLRPILDEFINTVIGRPNGEFWQAIYKPKRAYGATTVTGWIADLFPYLGDALNRRRSHIFEYKREHWAIPVEKGVETRTSPFDPGANKGVSGASFPSGLSSVPLRLSFLDESTRELDLVAGYFAVEQAPADLSLSPVIGWSVTERTPTTPVLIDGYSGRVKDRVATGSSLRLHSETDAPPRPVSASKSPVWKFW